MNGGTPFATNQFGTKVEIGHNTGILTVGYSVVNPGLGIQIPWSASPFYTYALIQGFLRAGEQAVMIGLSQTLKPVGLPDIAVVGPLLQRLDQRRRRGRAAGRERMGLPHRLAPQPQAPAGPLVPHAVRPVHGVAGRHDHQQRRAADRAEL